MHRFKNVREFAVENVVEGDYHLQITDLPAGTYVKSARFRAVDALNETLHVDSRTTDRLAAVLGADGGLLEGSVLHRSKNPVANASIVLVPVNVHQQRPDLYKRVSADESGLFQLRDIAPGDYVIFAWEDVGESVWRDPEFVRRNEAAGKRIHIGLNSRETQNSRRSHLHFEPTHCVAEAGARSRRARSVPLARWGWPSPARAD